MSRWRLSNRKAAYQSHPIRSPPDDNNEQGSTKWANLLAQHLSPCYNVFNFPEILQIHVYCDLPRIFSQRRSPSLPN